MHSIHPYPNHCTTVKLKLLSVILALLLTGTAVAQKSAKKIFYGEASFYANKFNGRQTANGEIFSQDKMTCACNALPLGTWVKITNLRNNKMVVVKVNDRLHPRMRRVTDLSRSAAKKLGYIVHGITRVKVEVLGKSKPEGV
jgi:rare lipoprotein A